MDGASVASKTFVDMDSDTFASYFSDWDPNSPPKVLITTSPKGDKIHAQIFRGAGGRFSPGPNLSGGRRSEDSRWAGLQGRP